MSRPRLKSADEPLVDDAAAAFQKFQSTMKKLVALPKSAADEKPKHAKKKRR
ncbi:MAG: hypothetical protein JWN24_376 [Phycisphaerales bacterium]|nr:hypothetical protein [Phycisphaerales bacterium]